MHAVLWVTVALWMSNFFLLFKRHRQWVHSPSKWYVDILLFATGMVVVVLNTPSNPDFNFLSGVTMTPLLSSLAAYGFKKLSFAIHGRDFYLWLRGSKDESDNTTEFRASDRIISILLMYIFLGLPILLLVLLKHIQHWR